MFPTTPAIPGTTTHPESSVPTTRAKNAHLAPNGETTSAHPRACAPDHLLALYAEVLQRVQRATGIPVRPMLYCNRTECVDARAILVNLLLRHTLTEHEVAALTSLSPQCVNKLKNNFQYRLRRWSVNHLWLALNSC